MEHLKLILFGAPHGSQGGEPVEITSTRGLAVLAYLAAEGACRREQLAGLLWPEHDESRARGNLRRILYTLNSTPFGSWIEADADQLALRGNVQEHVDVVGFDGLCNSEELEDARAAVRLYGGDFLAGVSLPDSGPYETWLTLRREQYRRQALATLDWLAQAALTRHDFSEAESAARRQIALDDLREPAWQQLLRALALSGRGTEALAEYERLERHLRAELDVAPAAETIQLVTDLRVRRTPERTRRPAPLLADNLPAASTPLVGRQAELQQLAHLFSEGQARLVTISGIGGIGKTRLALAYAAGRLGAYDQVAFVSLLPLVSPNAVVPAIADALRLIPQEGRPLHQQLLQFLADQSTLLVLDNAEHLLVSQEGGGDSNLPGLLQEMLAVAADLTLLVTSRERLRLPGEHLFLLGGMPIGEKEGGDGSAEGLFLAVARRHGVLQNHLSEAEESAIEEFCRLVDGMPLAVELAAAQARVLPPAALLAGVRQDLGLLASDARGRPDRHASLVAVFEASWQALPAAQQGVFARLAVFRGGFTYAAAEKVAGASPAVLGQLLDKSLIRGSAGRFTLHPLVQRFAAGKLAADVDGRASVQAAHQAYFASQLSAAAQAWRTSHEREPLDALRPDVENLRAAWHWLLERERCDLLPVFLDDLWQLFKGLRRLAEGIELLQEAERAAARPGCEVDPITRAHWQRLMGDGYLWLSQLNQGEQHLRNALTLLGWPLPAGSTRLTAGLVREVSAQALHRLLPRFTGRRPEQQAAAREAALAFERLAIRAAVENNTLLSMYCGFRQLNLAESAGLPGMMALGYAFVGYALALVPLHGTARRYFERAAAANQVGNSLLAEERLSRFHGLYHMGVGNWDAAVRHCEAAEQAARHLGEQWNAETSLVALQFAAHRRGDLQAASQYVRRLLESARRRGDTGFEAAALYWEAILKLHQPDTEEVLRLLEQSAAAPPEVMNTFDWILVHAASAEAHLRLDQPDAARVAAAKAADLIAAAPRPAHCASLDGYSDVARVYLQLWASGDDAVQPAAKQACQNLRAYAKIFAVAQPQYLLCHGGYAWLSGRQEAAREAWHTALATAEQLNMPWEAAWAHFQLGLHGTGRDRAAQLSQALDQMQAIGATYEATLIEAA